MKMNMKKIISWGMMLAAAFTLINCAKEIENPNQQPEVTGYPFEIIASTVDTKTVNDGVHTNWSAGDQINLIHAAAGTETYVSEAAFTIAAEDLAEGRFTGTLKGALTDGTHDWYVLYPYSSYTASPEKSGYLPIGCEPFKSQVQIQEGNGSIAHIAGPNYPLWGNVKGVGHDEKPELVMSHVSSLIKVVVTNATETPLTVENIAFTAPVDIVGTYYINFAGETVECTNSGTDYVSKTATLNVNNGEAIESGMSAEFYLAVRPFTAEAGSSLTLAVNGYTKEPKILTNALTFHAGKIKTLNFAYDYVAPAGEQTVTFDFTSAEELADLGIALPEVDGGTNVTSLAKGQVTLVAEGGSTITRIYNSAGKYDLRAYKGATLTFSVPSGYIITDVTLEGSATSISTSVVPSNPVVLTVAADASTQKISKITVTYVEGEVEVVPLIMNEVECANATSNSLTFTWLPVDGAVGYKVSVDGGVNYGEVQDETSYTWENLEPETEYTLYVKAIGNGLNTSDSEPVSSMATTDEEQEGVVTMSTTFTFTGSNGQKDFSVTRAPIKIAFAQVTGSYAPNDHGDGHVRVYKGNTMTFTGANIVKIELTYTTANYSGSGLSAGVGTLTQNTNTETWTWVGSSTSVVLTGGTTQGRYSSIVVYYESDGTIPEQPTLSPRNLAFSETSATATMEQAFNAPNLTGAKVDDVEYTSSNTGVATVNASTGAVTLVGAGTTTITATAPETGEYEAGTASYILTVSAAQGGGNPGQPTTVTIKVQEYASTYSWVNGTQYKTLKLDDVITATVSGGSNTGKYYTSGYEWRIYQTESPSLIISAAEGKTIETVKITYNVSNTGVLTLNSSNISSGTIVSVNATSVTFGVGNTGTKTNGQVKITAIEVVYNN